MPCFKCFFKLLCKKHSCKSCRKRKRCYEYKYCFECYTLIVMNDQDAKITVIDARMQECLRNIKQVKEYIGKSTERLKYSIDMINKS